LTESIELFNKHLAENTASYSLNETLEENYNLYIAKKNGNPKDDYPELGMNTLIANTGKERFIVCCFSSAFIAKKESAVVSAA
jgi:hypothetical protein